MRNRKSTGQFRSVGIVQNLWNIQGGQAGICPLMLPKRKLEIRAKPQERAEKVGSGADLFALTIPFCAEERCRKYTDNNRSTTTD